jgi:hypothetical protein
MADVRKILLCADVNMATVAAALDGVPGGGIANFSVELETVNAPLATWWGGVGLIPEEMVAALVGQPCELLDCPGTARQQKANFQAALAAHNPVLTQAV